MVKGDQWVGYEDATSITKKVKHVVEFDFKQIECRKVGSLLIRTLAIKSNKQCTRFFAQTKQ